LMNYSTKHTIDTIDTIRVSIHYLIPHKNELLINGFLL